MFESHLALRRQGSTEEDIEKNYAADVVVVSNWGTFLGQDGIRESARILNEHLPKSSFTYDIAVVEENVGFLVWSAESPSASVQNGVDSFVIKDDKIVTQTTYYVLG